jgi:hypothetical protein
LHPKLHPNSETAWETHCTERQLNHSRRKTNGFQHASKNAGVHATVFKKNGWGRVLVAGGQLMASAVMLLSAALVSVVCVLLFIINSNNRSQPETTKQYEKRLEVMGLLYEKRISEMRADLERQRADVFASGKNDVLENLQVCVSTTDELEDHVLWRTKQRRAMAVVLLRNKVLDACGDLNKLSIFEISPEIKKALAVFLSVGATAISGTPVTHGFTS